LRKQFNERTGGSLNRTQYSSDVIALVVFWRLRHKLSLRDLPEMFLLRGIQFTYEAVRDWEAKLTPLLTDNLRRRRGGGAGSTARGTSMRPTSKSMADGATCTGELTALAGSWT
jgi:transposase-like protein